MSVSAHRSPASRGLALASGQVLTSDRCDGMQTANLLSCSVYRVSCVLCRTCVARRGTYYQSSGLRPAADVKQWAHQLPVNVPNQGTPVPRLPGNAHVHVHPQSLTPVGWLENLRSTCSCRSPRRISERPQQSTDDALTVTYALPGTVTCRVRCIDRGHLHAPLPNSCEGAANTWRRRASSDFRILPRTTVNNRGSTVARRTLLRTYVGRRHLASCVSRLMSPVSRLTPRHRASRPGLWIVDAPSISVPQQQHAQNTQARSSVRLND